MKKLFRLSGLVMISAMVLASCASPATTPQVIQPTATAQAVQSTATSQAVVTQPPAQAVGPIHKVAKPITIGFTSWRMEDVDVWNTILAAFDKLNTNVKVEYRPILNTEYDADLKTKLQSGTADEILFVRSWDAGRILYDAKYLEPITDQMVPNIKQFADAQLASWRTEDGTIYGVPGNWVSLGVLYNKDIFAKYNITPPETIDDFLGVCKTLKKNGVVAVAGGSKDPWTLEQMFSEQFLPAYYGGEPGHVKLLAGDILPSSQPFIDMENLMLNVRDDCWPTGYQGLAYADTQQLFVTGGAAMFISGSWEIGVFEGLNKNLNMGFFPTPVLNKGDQKWLAMTPAGAYGLRAGLSPEQREAALVFLNFLASPDGAKAQLDLAGQFPSMPNTPAPADPLAQGFFTGGQGTNSPKLTIYWTFQTLNSKQPGAQQLTWEAFQALVNGSMTPEQAAKHIQDGIATWYTPWQNK